MIIIEVILFVLSSGILFHDRFKDNIPVKLVAGLVALVASYFLLEEIIDRTIDARLAQAPEQQYQPAKPETGSESRTPARLATPVAVITAKEIDAVFRAYIAAWQAGDLAAQANLLAPDFSYIDQERVRQNRSTYLRQKQELAAKYRASPFNANIRIGVSNVSVETHGEYGSVTYDQNYESPFYSSFGRNRFNMRKSGTAVRIVEEIFDRKRVVRRDPAQQPAPS